MKSVRRNRDCGEMDAIYRQVIENLRVGIVVVQDGVIKFANRNACLLFDNFNIINRPIVEFIHPDSMKNFVELYRRAVEGEKGEMQLLSEFVIKRESGDVFVEVTAIPITLAKSKAILLLLDDVTMERYAGRELKEMRRFQEAIFMEMPYAMMVCDRNLKIVNANKALEDIAGKVIGRKLYDIICEDEYVKTVDMAEKLVNDSLKDFPVMLRGARGNMEVRLSASRFKTDGFDGYIFVVDESISDACNLVEMLPDAVLIYEDGIVFANPMACSVFGVENVEELVGKSLLDFIPPEMGKLVLDWSKAVISDSLPVLPIELPFILPDGSDRVFELKGSRISGNRMLIVLRDVTDRKRLEEELKESKEEFAVLAENSIAGVFIVQDGVFKYVNPTLASIGGYTREEMIGKSPAEFIHPDDVPVITDRLERRLRGEKVVSRYIARGLTKNGEVRLLEFFASRAVLSGKPAVVGVVIDVTETERVRNRFKSLFEHAPDIICILDGEGRIVDINRDAFGYSRSEMVGKYLWEFCVERDAVKELLKVAGGSYLRVQVEMEKKSGERVEYDCSVSRILDRDGVIVILRDVTEKRMLSRNLNEAVDTLKLLNRMLRHDILNNLNVILLTLESVKVSGKDKVMIRHALNSVEKSVRLIERARELEKMLFSGRSLKGVRVIEIVEEVAKRHPEVEVNIVGDLNILADEAFESVVDNIISNSKKHGKATRVDVEMTENGNYCIIKFKDNGTGIPDEIKEKVFQEGFVAGESGNTGLGMFIVKQVVNRYGGEVWIEDNFPRGTIVSMKLRKA